MLYSMLSCCEILPLGSQRIRLQPPVNDNDICGVSGQGKYYSNNKPIYSVTLQTMQELSQLQDGSNTSHLWLATGKRRSYPLTPVPTESHHSIPQAIPHPLQSKNTPLSCYLDRYAGSVGERIDLISDSLSYRLSPLNVSLAHTFRRWLLCLPWLAYGSSADQSATSY